MRILLGGVFALLLLLAANQMTSFQIQHNNVVQENAAYKKELEGLHKQVEALNVVVSAMLEKTLLEKSSPVQPNGSHLVIPNANPIPRLSQRENDGN